MILSSVRECAGFKHQKIHFVILQLEPICCSNSNVPADTVHWSRKTAFKFLFLHVITCADLLCIIELVNTSIS